MEILGAPNREVCTIRRERTNTPLQALVVLNDPQFIEASRKLAALTIQSASDDVQRMQFIASRLLSRPLQNNELEILQRGFQQLHSYYTEHPQDAELLLNVGQSVITPELDKPQLAAWTMLASEVMNLDETLCK
jgi:hypothetical protein